MGDPLGPQFLGMASSAQAQPEGPTVWPEGYSSAVRQLTAVALSGGHLLPQGTTALLRAFPENKYILQQQKSLGLLFCCRPQDGSPSTGGERECRLISQKIRASNAVSNLKNRSLRLSLGATCLHHPAATEEEKV